jgi:hypothetical protein
MIICPTCGRLLEQVTYNPDYQLSWGQWESVRCGDYYCDHCRCYFWVRLEPSDLQSTYSLRPELSHAMITEG